MSLARGERIRVGVASLSASSDQGVESQLIGIAWRRNQSTVLGFSVGRAAVDGIVRTDADPQALGEVPYSSIVLSASGRRELFPHVSAGLALRWREGTIDRLSRHATAADVGLLIDKLPYRSARFAISSFLWRPGREIEDRPSVVSALDFVAHADGTNEYRVGYSYHSINRGARETGPYLLARIDRFEGSVSVLHTSVSGRNVNRIRSGIALRYNRYLVGVGREEGNAGLGPMYQFTLSSMLR
jgi:hypothetical protein